ncbi:unnamed protein product [Mesocestoides corti]|uniref:Nucleic acid binding protein n=1 Tax=Mesocestoides corti TaxID=53468 RepID=A0A0R3U229_MESCO|nr:unnamed protein product [Mesocestoides corti]
MGFTFKEQLAQTKPKNAFYTTEFGTKCHRYYCAACGECHPMNECASRRLVEHITGTGLPDAAFRASEAYVIDDYVQGKFQVERRKLRREHHCKPTESFPFPEDKQPSGPIIRPCKQKP